LFLVLAALRAASDLAGSGGGTQAGGGMMKKL
jgi:hypothetical protein